MQEKRSLAFFNSAVDLYSNAYSVLSKEILSSGFVFIGINYAIKEKTILKCTINLLLEIKRNRIEFLK